MVSCSKRGAGSSPRPCHAPNRACIAATALLALSVVAIGTVVSDALYVHRATNGLGGEATTELALERAALAIMRTKLEDALQHAESRAAEADAREAVANSRLAAPGDAAKKEGGGAAEAGAPSITTTWNCQGSAPWVEVCVYKNICRRGGHGTMLNPVYLFVDPAMRDDEPIAEEPTWEKSRIVEGLYWPESAEEVRMLYFTRSPRQLPRLRVTTQSGMGALRVPVSYIPNDATWVKENVWRTPWTLDVDHALYAISRTMPLSHMKTLNYTGKMHPPLPPMGPGDILQFSVPSEKPLGRLWAKTMIEFNSGNQSRVEFLDGQWMQDIEDPFHTTCFTTLVVYGPYEMGAPDHQFAYRFRENLYADQRVSLPSKPEKRVLFWSRPRGKGRYFSNMHELIAVVKAYDIPYTIIEDKDIPKSVKGQLELFSSHGIFVTATGSGLTNAMFLVPFSSVIEVFPPLIDQNLGQTISTISGMGYYPIHTHNASAVYREHNSTAAGVCRNSTGMQFVTGLTGCRPYEYVPFTVDVRDFESAFVSAVDHTGHLLRHRAYLPVRDASTPSGWKRRLRKET